MRPQMRRNAQTAYSYYAHPWQGASGNTNGHRCPRNGLHPAPAVDHIVQRFAKETLADPEMLSGSFKKYIEILQSGNNPTRNKLKAAQKRTTSIERKISRLLELYLDEAISKEEYAARKKPLDIQMEKQSEELDALSQELEQSMKLEEHMESITKFAEEAAAGVDRITGIDHWREVVRRLGLQVELDEDDKNRYVDLVLVLPGLCAMKDTLRIARHLGSQTSLPPTIFRTRITLPPRRARRNTGSAS